MCSSFVSSLPTKCALHRVSLLLQCKSLSAITSSLFAKVILLLLQYSFSAWVKFQPLILGFSSSAELPSLESLISYLSLLLLCLELSFSFLRNQTTFHFCQIPPESTFLVYASLFVIVFLESCWPIPQAASSTPTVFLLYLCGEF